MVEFERAMSWMKEESTGNKQSGAEGWCGEGEGEEREAAEKEAEGCRCRLLPEREMESKLSL
jgi:hypothetical protein